MEEVFEAWDKIQNINIDFIVFVFVFVFVFKLKDFFELFFRFSTHRTEQLNAAKKLLEGSGYANSKEMNVVKSMMKSHAVKIATNLINKNYGNLYCYLFSKSTEEAYGLHKTISFIENNDDEFYFNDRELTKTRYVGVGMTLIIIFFTIFMSVRFKMLPDINLSWLFNSFVIVEVGFCLYWLVKVMPNDVEVRYTKKLLKKTNVDEFNEYQKTLGDVPSGILPIRLARRRRSRRL